jgi:predicted ArsR family transcriptional regulator
MAEPAAEPRKRMLERVRDYAVDQPSFTTAFAAWELEVSPSAVNLAVKQLAKRGEVVPHTRAKGSSGKPGLDHKRQENGIRVKRGRSTGYGGR